MIDRGLLLVLLLTGTLGAVGVAITAATAL